MSVDIAALGFSVESSEAEIAAARLAKLKKATAEAETAAMRLQRQADKVGKSLKSMGKNMSLFVTAPLLAFGVASVKAFSDFESSFANVRKTVDGTVEQLAQLSNELRDLAKTVPTTVNELNNLAGVAGQLGVRRENIVEFTRVIAMLGDTTDIAGEQAALSLSRFMNIMGTAQGDIDRVGATIVGLGNNFAAMESEIVSTATSLAAFGSAMGLTEAQVLAFATAIAASGGQTEAASTAFQKTASIMQRAVIEINEDLRTFADVAGVSAEEFARAFREDAAGAIQLFLRGLKGIRDEGLSTAAVLEELGLADQRLQREFGKLLGNLDQLDDALVQSADEWERNTALVDEAQKRYETFASQLQITKNQINDVAIELGAELAPMVLKMAIRVRDMVVAFKELDPATQKIIVKTGLLVAALGPLLIVIGSVVRAIVFLTPLIITLARAIALKLMVQLFAFRALMITMGVSLGVVTGLVLAGVAALGLLAFAMRDTAREATELDKEIDALIESMKDFGKTSFDLAVDKLNMAIAENDSLIVRLRDNFEMLATLQSQPMGAQASDRMAEQMVNLAQQIKVAEAEADHLREQLGRLTQAQIEMNEAIANDELMARYDATMKLLAENFAWLEKSIKATVGLTEDEADALADLIDVIDPAAKASRELAEAQDLLEKALKAGVKNGGISFKMYQKLSMMLIEATDAFKDAAKAAAEFSKMNASIEWELDQSMAFVENLEEMEQQVQALEDSLDPIGAALREMGEAYLMLNEAFESGAIDDETFIRMSEAVDRAVISLELMDSAFMQIGTSALASLQELQGMLHEDSAAAESVRMAMLALNIAMGIYAVIKQLAGGDVYSAIPRALGVAAMVASMGVSTGASGRAASASRSLLESQGTGSVLGDAEAKTESILKASEITAEATSELVGINRGMLNALQNLQTGLGGAATQLSRGAGNDTFGALPIPSSFIDDILTGSGLFNLFGLNFVGEFLKKIFGGKSKLIDEGIRIVGGTLADLTNEVLVSAFQSFKEKKNLLSSYKDKIRFQDLDSGVGAQFALVFASLADTVTAGAIALGVPLDLIEERLEAFQIATMDISFRDLTGEEIQEELLAVFGEIFDDLAAHVVPFIDDFQKVGEGLGETLVRVATSVQVTQEAVRMLGLALDETDPKKFADISVGLIEMAGGVEESFPNCRVLWKSLPPMNGRMPLC